MLIQHHLRISVPFFPVGKILSVGLRSRLVPAKVVGVSRWSAMTGGVVMVFGRRRLGTGLTDTHGMMNSHTQSLFLLMLIDNNNSIS